MHNFKMHSVMLSANTSEMRKHISTFPLLKPS